MKYSYTLLVLAFVLCSLTVSFAQNSPDFFKTVPVIDENTPEWAKLMYSENPNVPEVENLYRAYYRNNEFVKNIHTQNHKHWIRLVEPLLDDDGYIKQKSRKQEALEAQRLKNRFREHKLSGTDKSSGWISMGPFETFKKNTSKPVSWHKNVYAIDQSLSNPNILICGTEAGGVYKTVDKGANWTLITKGEIFASGNSAVKIHPTDPDNFLVASNRRIYQSLDGGETWHERHFTEGEGNEFQYSTADYKTIFHTSSSGLFKTTDGGTTWEKIFTESCWDIDFHPTDNSIAYLLKSNDDEMRCEVFKSTDAGSTWELKDNGYYEPTDWNTAYFAGGKIGVTPASPDLVYVCLIGDSKAEDSGWIGVYKSSDKGESWTNPAGQDGGPYGEVNNTQTPWNVAAYESGYHQGFFNFDLEVSSVDPNKLWIATIRLSESTDGGKTFTSIGAANSQRLADFHADVQDIEVNGNDIWVASDGGINYSSDELNTHVALNKGIQAAHFWGFNTGWNEDSFTGGKYHDGTSGWYEGYKIGDAYNIGGVEEASGYVHPIESRKLLFRTHYNSANTTVLSIPKIFGETLKYHPEFPIRPNESYSAAERSGIYFDPRYANHIYVGLQNKVYKSTDGGVNFDVLYTFPDDNGLVYEMEISRSNPDVIYAVYNPEGTYWDPCEVWKTTDGGNSWAKTATDPDGNNKRLRITINPEDENNIWTCTPRGGDDGKVSSSTDGGKTWINRTTSTLDKENVRDILYQGGTDDLVYLVSLESVYYWDKNIAEWIDYSQDLPLVPKSLQINPFYRDAELRLATTGRGVWGRKMVDTSFRPVAQPVTYSDIVDCSRDTVLFDCYSILNHENAKWEWSFSPEPIYVSSQNARNPKVVFGNEGVYDVSLTVTDGQGQKDTKLIENMITVRNLCMPDSLAGNALYLAEGGEYFVSPEVDLTNITHFTATAWIKPNGSQNGFAGIISNAEWCAHCDTPIGLVYDYYGEDLFYRWPLGDEWYSSSKLSIQPDKWSFVAMVITPDSVTLYHNNDSWVSHVSLEPVDLSALYVGAGHYSTFFKGYIDEVTIWTRALSDEEIKNLKHLTKKNIIDTDQDLFAYYQFNTQFDNATYDNARGNHGWLSGGATLAHSTAPIGPGVSERLTIDQKGKYNSELTGVELEFGDTNPQGDIVITRLNVLPDSLPNSNPSIQNYWIINNYGELDFDVLNNIRFKSAFGSPFGSPSDATLLVRDENEYKNNWETLCSAVSYDNDSYNFTNSCNITNTHQFFIQSKNQSDIQKWLAVQSIDTTICKNESIYLAGEWRNQAGVYRDTVNISQALDSIYITTLTIAEVDTTVTQEAKTLTANAQNADYQWIDCSTQQAIPGETARSFTPAADGNYAVEVTQYGCADTSSCYKVNVSGVLESNFDHEISVFPNPTDGKLNIDLRKPYQNLECKIYNTAGQLIETKSYKNISQINYTLKGAAGYYLIELSSSDSKKAVLKVLKK